MYTDKTAENIIRFIATALFLIALGSTVPHILSVVNLVISRLMPLLNF